MIYKLKVLIYKWRRHGAFIPDLYSSVIANNNDWGFIQRLKAKIRIWKVHYLYTSID